MFLHHFSVGSQQEKPGLSLGQFGLFLFDGK
jgi:hypothetical protein